MKNFSLKVLIIFSSWYLVCLAFLLFSSSSVVFCVSLLICSILVAFSVFIKRRVWFGLIFFFIFISGLLVLVFYIVSADFKVIVLENSPTSTFWVVIRFFFVFPTGFMVEKNFSENFFTRKNFFTIYFFCFIIFFVLWLVTKLLFSNSGQLRRLF